jgi:hypothetical protein
MILVSPLIVIYVYFSVPMYEFTLETFVEKSERESEIVADVTI